MSWLWGAFLRLYPREHREQFGAEMRAVFEAASKERRGWRERLRFDAREIAGLMSGATAERFRRNSRRPEDLSPSARLETQIQTNLRRMEQAIASHQFERARFYSYYDLKLREQLRKAVEDRDKAA